MGEELNIFCHESTQVSLNHRFTVAQSRETVQATASEVFSVPSSVEDDAFSVFANTRTTNKDLVDYLIYKDKINERMMQQRMNVRKRLGSVKRGFYRFHNMRNFYKGGIKSRLAFANKNWNNSSYISNRGRGHFQGRPTWRRWNRRFNNNRSYNQNKSFNQPNHRQSFNSSFNGSFNNRRQSGGWGRGRGRGGMRRNAKKPVTREELDKELDDIMASSKATLDKELDQYMNQEMELDASML